MDVKISNTLYVIKAFAILSVITAHMTFSESYPVAEIVRTSLGQIGVVIFFVVAGYFYSRTKGDNIQFWQRKIKTLIIPWLIFSTLVFLLSSFVFGDPNNLLFGFIKNYFGIGTVYWYMTVLTIMLFVFKYLNKSAFLYSCIVISLISIFLSILGIIDYYLVINQYLNVFNWIGFFAFGILLRRKNLLEKLVSPLITVISFVGLFFAVVGAVMRGGTIEAYIDVTSIFVELFGFLLFLNLSYYLANNNLLIDIGKKSFFIYLIHIQVVGIINTRLPYNVLFFIFRPFVGLAVCYLIAVIIKIFLKIIKLERFNFVFGLDR